MKIQEILTKCLSHIANFEIPLPDKETESFNDVYYELTDDLLAKMKYKQYTFEQPVIRSSEDLIEIIVKILRKFISNENNMFTTQMIQIISEIKDPLEEENIDSYDENNIKNKIEKIMTNLKNCSKELDNIKIKLDSLRQQFKGKKKR